MKTRPRPLHFALSITRDNSPDRALIEGVALFSEEHPDCRFQLIPQEKFEREIRARRFDGIIFRVLNERISRFVSQTNIPTVDLQGALRHPGVSAVCPDNEAIGRMAAEHFLERGFRNFAFFGYRDVAYSDERRNGFLSRLAQNGYTATTYEAPTSPLHKFGSILLPGYLNATPNDEKALVKNLLAAPKPLAAFCCHDPRAVCLLEVCRKIGLSVPNDVAVLGVDDDSVYCTFSSPKLSSIDMDGKSIGYEAARLLNDLCTKPRGRRADTLIRIPPRAVVVRESSEVYPIKPTWLSDALVFIKRNATGGISALDVFNYLGLSHTLIQATFRRVRHSSVQKEIIAERMSVARKFLKTTTLPIASIASAAGFASARYFCQAFTRLYGVSPSEWRRSGE